MPLHIPSLCLQDVDDHLSTNILLRMTQVKQKCVVRFTGGCANMSSHDAEGLYDLFVSAFHGFRGALLFGGTRMVMRNNFDEVLPSITEVPPLIRDACPEAWLTGVVPRTADFELHPQLGITIHPQEEQEFITILHQAQDQCLAVQGSVDTPADWDTEWQTCVRIITKLRNFAQFKSLTISYNGGGVTEHEILATADLGWPLLLIRGSGRKTDEYAKNREFLSRYPNVICADADAQSVRRALTELGIV